MILKIGHDIEFNNNLFKAKERVIGSGASRLKLKMIKLLAQNNKDWRGECSPKILTEFKQLNQNELWNITIEMSL